MPFPNAYVTLLYSAAYLPGALVLAKSLRDLNSTAGKFVVLIPKNHDLVFTAHQLHLLSSVYDEVIQVDLLDSSNVVDLANLHTLLKRPELIKTLTKIQIYKFFDKYNKIVYLDSDLLVLQNLDHLFDIEITDSQIAAAPDAGWPDIFNSGLFLIKPSLNTYKQLSQIVDSSSTNSSFDGADQGLLNEFYQSFGKFNSDKTRSWKPLSFLYNVTPNGQYQYTPAYKRFAKDINVLHFIGALKPWANKVPYYDIAKLSAAASVNEEYNGDAYGLTALWWKIFYKHYGADADIKSVIYNNELNAFPADYKYEKYDSSKNFEQLSLEDEKELAKDEDLESDAGEEEALVAAAEPKTIIDVMFSKNVRPERRFGPDPF